MNNIYRYRMVTSLENDTTNHCMKQLLVQLEELSSYMVLFVDLQMTTFDWESYRYYFNKMKDKLLYRYHTTNSYACQSVDKIGHILKSDIDVINVIAELSENHLSFQDAYGKMTNPFADLCLLRDDKWLLLGTLSHEGMADLFLTEEEEANRYISCELQRYDVEKSEIADLLQIPEFNL